MSRFAVVFALALGFAAASTVLAGLQLVSPPPTAQSTVTNGTHAVPPVTFGATLSVAPQPSLPQPSIVQTVLQYFEGRSLVLAPSGWFLVGGLWIWRGRVRSRWESLGFDSEVFELFVRMRGGKTRVSLLNSLFIPKDRFQLANELGMDWKAVDRHIMRLSKAGFVREETAYGRVRMYELTVMGKTLLGLLKEMSVEEAAKAGLPVPRVD